MDSQVRKAWIWGTTDNQKLFTYNNHQYLTVYLFLISDIFLVINLLMSEQVEGHLSLPISYSFNRDKLAQYQNQSIDSKKFHSWVQNDMYRSTYAQHHSPVFEFSFWIHCHPKIHTFQGIVDLSQRTGLKVCTLRLFQTRQWGRS